MPFKGVLPQPGTAHLKFPLDKRATGCIIFLFGKTWERSHSMFHAGNGSSHGAGRGNRGS